MSLFIITSPIDQWVKPSVNLRLGTVKYDVLTKMKTAYCNLCGYESDMVNN